MSISTASGGFIWPAGQIKDSRCGACLAKPEVSSEALAVGFISQEQKLRNFANETGQGGRVTTLVRIVIRRDGFNSDIVAATELTWLLCIHAMCPFDSW